MTVPALSNATRRAYRWPHYAEITPDDPMNNLRGALLMTLAASASYIAVPAAMRLALPEADPSVSLTLSLGITFPFNLVFGIPLYFAAAQAGHLQESPRSEALTNGRAASISPPILRHGHHSMRLRATSRRPGRSTISARSP